MVYLDYAATTPVRPEAAQAAMQVMTEEYANPSAQYAFGSRATQRLKEDRAAVASALGCRPKELIFTSCGTEGDNWAIRTAVDLGRHTGKHIITTAIEHSAVLATCRQLASQGYEVTYLEPNAQGNVSLEELEKALRPDTVLVSMMLVNNELGTILPVPEAVRLTRKLAPKALFHCDAVQGFLKVPFTPAGLGVDFLAVSGHKIGAPKGIGALYVKKSLLNRVKPMLYGGGQEGGLRSGTEPTAQIAAFAVAARLGRAELEANTAHMADVKAYALKTLTAAVPTLKRVGAGEAPHILALTLPNARSEVLVRELGDMGFCTSKGSACHRGSQSQVFQAMPISKGERDGAFRISFSAQTTREEIEQFAAALKTVQEKRFPIRTERLKRRDIDEAHCVD